MAKTGNNRQKVDGTPTLGTAPVVPTRFFRAAGLKLLNQLRVQFVFSRNPGACLMAIAFPVHQILQRHSSRRVLWAYSAHTIKDDQLDGLLEVMHLKVVSNSFSLSGHWTLGGNPKTD